MPSRGTQLRGLIDTVRSGRVAARTLAIADSRSLVRSMFLASAVRMELLQYLRGGREFAEIVGFTGATDGRDPVLDLAEHIVVVRRDRFSCLGQALLEVRHTFFWKHSQLISACCVIGYRYVR